MTTHQPHQTSATTNHTLWFWYIGVFAAAVAATAYATQTHPLSKTTLYLIGATYATHLVVNSALTIPTILNTPSILRCRKHWRY